LVAGARLEGEVAGVPGRVVVVSGGLRIPLPEGQQLFSPGQRVAIQIRTDQQGAPLAILSAASKPSLPVSHTFAAATTAPTAHPELVPPVLADKPAAAAQVAALLNQREGLGNVLAPLIRFAQSAVAGANASPDLGNALAAVLAPLLRPDAAELPAAIKRWVERATRAHESTLSRAARGQTSQPQADIATAKSLIESMRNDAVLRQWLTDRSEVRTFENAADRALDRLNAGQLQQLRNVDHHPYWFMDLPFDPESGVNRAMVHLFQDGGRGGDEAENATVVFDLSLTQLGDVWVKLSLYRDRCVCRFGVTDPGVFELLGQFEPELADALRSTGARDVTVDAELWDGDRRTRTASLMRPLNGVDVSA
jgi:hypothetical protein